MSNTLNRKAGKQSVIFGNAPRIISYAAIVGQKEGAGPLHDSFDIIAQDDKMGAKSWDLAEAKMQNEAYKCALKKARLSRVDMDYVLCGDLQNQCAATHYALRDSQIPFYGLYGACSTMTESLSLGAMLTGAGYADKVMCLTSSHFCAAEKQYRNPLEYGGQRTPSAQWTVTGAGAAILAVEGDGPRITSITTGRIVDKGVKDISNMGAAMAPAAADTIISHFRDTGTRPDDYDLILTGDLGIIGSDILCELMLDEGYDIREEHNDCGKMIYAIEAQDVHAGASGCGCCAAVLCSYVLRQMESGTYHRVLAAATGALMNPLTVEQGESIPAISHAVAIEAEV